MTKKQTKIGTQNLMTKSPIRALMLKEVEQLICSDRNSSYGEPFDNMDRTAQMMRAYLGNRKGNSINSVDVAIFGIILKLGRLANNPEHSDSLKDVAGYSAIAFECAWEIHEREVKEFIKSNNSRNKS